MKFTYQIEVCLAVFLAFAALNCPAFAMSFTLNGDLVSATGEIAPGDAQSLAVFLKSRRIKTDEERSFKISLSSPGGNLFEGMKLGTVIRDAGLATTVRRAQVCASACALAYLGGLFVGAAADAVGRELEYGALLGFHGFSLERDKVVLMNESLERSRVVSGLILEYAERMGGVDLGWLSRNLNVSANDIYFVRTPADIRALSISMLGLPTTVPQDWNVNVCRKVVEPFRPRPDGFGERVTQQSETIKTIKGLRQALINGRFGDSPTSLLFQTLNDSDAIDLVIAEPFFLDQKKPILDVQSVRLERGAGFYFDRCLLVRSKASVGAFLLDSVGQRAFFKEFNEVASILAMHSDVRPLW